jgi:23S rRNA pseudouridine2605 synthase
MEHLGYSVSRLIRTSFGPFQLGKMARGSVEEVPARVLASNLPRDVKADAAHHRR